MLRIWPMSRNVWIVSPTCTLTLRPASENLDVNRAPHDDSSISTRIAFCLARTLSQIAWTCLNRFSATRYMRSITDSLKLRTNTLIMRQRLYRLRDVGASMAWDYLQPYCRRFIW